ncbi:hypothetical protein GQ457_15G018650 [Hibiscus cannabinus]
MKNDDDFLNLLPPNLSMKIFTSYEDPSDLVRISVVSRSWRHFAFHVQELCGPAKGAGAEPSNFMEWETLEREHRVYAFLAQQCSLLAVGDCTSKTIIASSTDNPEESIDSTLKPRYRVVCQVSYWSSNGQSNPAVPETLTYKFAKSDRFRWGEIKDLSYSQMGLVEF